MKPQLFIVTPNDYDPRLNVLATKVTFLASNAATEGYGITLQQGDEGMGPPLHSNRNESFYARRKGDRLLFWRISWTSAVPWCGLQAECGRKGPGIKSLTKAILSFP